MTLKGATPSEHLNRSTDLGTSTKSFRDMTITA
jgi:hypothetical protein